MVGDPLIISILHSIVIVFKEFAAPPEKVNLILPQSYICSLGSDGIQSETLRGRLERK
jgi:hypothetical protein